MPEICKGGCPPKHRLQFYAVIKRNPSGSGFQFTPALSRTDSCFFFNNCEYAFACIFVQLAQVWDNMEDVSQSRVAEILGGTRNTSGIMSTITNIKDAIGAYSSAMDSAGTATEANNVYMDTTKARNCVSASNYCG